MAQSSIFLRNEIQHVGITLIEDRVVLVIQLSLRRVLFRNANIDHAFSVSFTTSISTAIRAVLTCDYDVTHPVRPKSYVRFCEEAYSCPA